MKEPGQTLDIWHHSLLKAEPNSEIRVLRLMRILVGMARHFQTLTYLIIDPFLAIWKKNC